MPRPQDASLLLAGLALAFFHSGCSSVPDEDAAAPQPLDVQSIQASNQTEQLVGEVTLVNEVHEFVLIRTSYLPSLDPGKTLEIRRGLIPIGQISPSGERKGRLIVADVLEGEPRIGDMVIFHSSIAPDPPEKKSGFFSKFSESRERNKQMREFRKAAQLRNEMEKANSWTQKPLR